MKKRYRNVKKVRPTERPDSMDHVVELNKTMDELRLLLSTDDISRKDFEKARYEATVRFNKRHRGLLV